jgi:hypothetical protein
LENKITKSLDFWTKGPEEEGGQESRGGGGEEASPETFLSEKKPSKKRYEGVKKSNGLIAQGNCQGKSFQLVKKY